MNKTWNLKLPATGDLPETTIEGISDEQATKILRGLVYGPPSSEYAYVEAVRAGARARHDAHESPLAA